MEAEKLLNLFDSNWFEREIFERRSVSQPSSTNPVEKTEEEEEKRCLSRMPTRHVRSHSDQLLLSTTSFIEESPSSLNSVLVTPKLQTILSGKEAEEFSDPEAKLQAIEIHSEKQQSNLRSRRTRGNSKSLSELEFEELKGFMDLGFVFSEGDKDSRLVEIIPGLQRLGRKTEEGEETEDFSEQGVSRPYLSEAWEVLDQRKKEKRENPLSNWQIPAIQSDLDMKDHLKFWAHMVASTVR
ncbi:Protein of unknown function DUF1685 [Dillenia turbinata]|uniref:Uncharacterized protein n=1 Tax=Dillenia turbinata TaxID=194707 RepID=A0AAN8USA9_9MAGN